MDKITQYGGDPYGSVIRPGRVWSKVYSQEIDNLTFDYSIIYFRGSCVLLFSQYEYYRKC